MSSLFKAESRLDSTKRSGLAAQGIIVPFTTFFLIGVVCFLLFCTFRTTFNDVFSPRRNLSKARPPRIAKGFFAWMATIIRVEESFLVSTVGLDGVMLLRFFKMGFRLFTVLGILGMVTLAPVNYYASESTQNGREGIWDESKLMRQITVENIPQGSPLLKFHLAYLYVVSLISYAFLINYYREYVNLKLSYQEHVLRKSKLSKIDMRTVMVYGIPSELRYESDLALYYEGLGIGKVDSVVICRKWSRLRQAVEMRAYNLAKLESIYGQVIQSTQKKRSRAFMFYNGANSASQDSIGNLDVDDSSADFIRIRFSENDSTDASIFEIMSRLDAVSPEYRPKHRVGFMGFWGSRVDSAEYYSSQFKIWDRKVDHLRKFPVGSSIFLISIQESSPPTAVGFITFESPESAVLCAQANVASRPFACISRMAPEPRDIYWPNLSSRTADPYIKVFRSMFVHAALFFMIFFNTIIVSAISSLFDLDSISMIFPVYFTSLIIFKVLEGMIKGLSPVTKQFIQGVVPTAVLSLWTSCLPSLLIVLSQMQGLEARSWIEMSVMSKYFFYQFWNILFVVVVSSTVYKSLWTIQSPREVIEILANSLPAASPTLINYAMLQALALYPAQLLLVGPLFLTWVYRLTSYSRSTTPREISDTYYPSLLTTINYGIAYPIPILLCVVGLIYAPIAPVISIFCAVFFSVAYGVYKYMLLYVHIPAYETGGMHAPMAVRRCLVGMVVMQLTMMGVLALKSTPIGGEEDGGEGSVTTYFSYVLAVMPLLFCTATLFWWFKHGYEKAVTHVPLDLLGKVGREVAKVIGKRQEYAMAKGRPDADEFDKELTPVAGRVVRKQPSVRALDRIKTFRSDVLSLKSKESQMSIAFGGHRGDDMMTVTEEDLSEDNDPPGDRKISSLFNPDTHELVINIFENTDDGDEDLTPEFNDTASATPSSPFISSPQVTPVRRRVSFLVSGGGGGDEMHLEPPMTRVFGILDPPLESSIPVIPDMDTEDLVPGDHSLPEDNTIPRNIDLTLYTYLHPALIGRLPIAWLSTGNQLLGSNEQPRRLVEAREEQKYLQADLWKRVVGKQRIGVSFAADEEGEDDGNGDDAHTSLLGGIGSRRRRTTSRVKSYIDGLSSWAHLQMQ